MFWLTLLVSTLGGGIVAAIITAILNRHNVKEQERQRFRENQIQFLYGPLYYWISNSEKLLELNDRILKAHAETGKMAKEQSQKTIDIANEYVEMIQENNKRMLEILEKYYSYIEVNDIDIFKLFYEHCVRMKIEKNEKFETETPIQIYLKVGYISHLSPEVIQRVKEVFLSKKNDLEKRYCNKTAISKGGSMQLKNKKMIAREWLIISGILIIGGLLIIIGEHAGNKFKEHQVIKLPKGFVLDTPSTLPDRPSVFDVNKFPDKPASVQKDKSFDPDAYLAKSKSNIIPNLFDNITPTPNRKVSFLVDFFQFLNNLGYFLLIFAYPIYWLSRFTIWAIRTLKQVEPQK